MKNLLYFLTFLVFVLLSIVVYQKIHSSHDHSHDGETTEVKVDAHDDHEEDHDHRSCPS